MQIVNCDAKDPLSWLLCQSIGTLLVHLDFFVSFVFVLIVVIHLLGVLLAWCSVSLVLYHWYGTFFTTGTLVTTGTLLVTTGTP